MTTEIRALYTRLPAIDRLLRDPAFSSLLAQHGHSQVVTQLRQMLESGSPVGRKADFLIQEFNREANTIGSKCQNADIAKVVVDLKSEIEKIREQIQNIE